jgi:hypothetical protein
MPEPSAPDPVPDPAAVARGRVRLTSVVGAVASACLCASFFLPWVRVDDAVAEEFHATMQREAQAGDTPSAGARAFLALSTDLRHDHVLRGIDLITWVHASQAVSRDLDRASNPGLHAGAHERRLTLVEVLLFGMPLAAFGLCAHFLVHRFRRARAPVLVLCLLTGLAAVVTAWVFDFTQRFSAAVSQGAASNLGAGWHLGAGWACLLAGGATLGLAGIFGVRTGNWLKVYVVSGATAAGLALLAAHYVQSGSVP